MKKRFGIDIDGTVTCPSAFVPYLNQAFHLNITLDDIKEYDFMPLVDVSEEEFAQWFKAIEPKIYAESPLAVGALPVLKKWEKLFELHFISARDSNLLEVTKEWFYKQNMPFHTIDLLGSHNKIEAAKKYDVEIFFEDKHDNAVNIYEECRIPVLLFNTPYNQEPVPDGVIRVNNWQEANLWVNHWLNKN
ncbi:hypothetical protein ACE38V_03130 [Cytobacillus sp. Hz8]|uniref:hypothetical protein n=1 Tax=Cytobacillus sp. Hz8 TaxID=3347168 RepID=UPI0035D57DF3